MTEIEILRQMMIELHGKLDIAIGKNQIANEPIKCQQNHNENKKQTAKYLVVKTFTTIENYIK